MNRTGRTIVALVLSSAAALALARPSNVTEGEMALLPPYCPDTQGFKYGNAYSNTSPRASYWVGRMGRSFWAVHHYCWALITLHRSQQAGVAANTRKNMLQSALGDYRYTIENSTPDFVLLPELYTRVGDVEMLLGNIGSAYEAFQQARDIKPDYWPAYLRWATVLVKSNQRSKALDLIAEGLRHAPDAAALLEEYRRLGGDPGKIAGGKGASETGANYLQPLRPGNGSRANNN